MKLAFFFPENKFFLCVCVSNVKQMKELIVEMAELYNRRVSWNQNDYNHNAEQQQQQQKQ